MPLSDHEQRLLSQMEQQLQAEDPRFASTMRGHHDGRRIRRWIIGGVAVLAGIALLVLGVAKAMVPLGLVGFVLMLAGTAYMLSKPSPDNRQLGIVESDGRTRPTGGKRTQTFMQRMEHRWERRRQSGGW